MAAALTAPAGGDGVTADVHADQLIELMRSTATGSGRAPTGLIRVEIDGNVGRIRLPNPPLNSLTQEALAGLDAAVERSSSTNDNTRRGNGEREQSPHHPRCGGTRRSPSPTERRRHLETSRRQPPAALVEHIVEAPVAGRPLPHSWVWQMFDVAEAGRPAPDRPRHTVSDGTCSAAPVTLRPAEAEPATGV
jgi:hypothetical protein